MPPFAVIELAFDPQFQLGDLVIRWQTIGLTISILIAFGFAALIDGYLVPARATGAHEDPPAAPAVGRDRLRLDDMGYMVLGIVPGAVIGGRVVHGLAFWDVYAAAPLRLFDPAVGSLSLLGAVLGGAVTGAYVARLLGAPMRRWADAAALPLLLALGLGKLAQLLGGSGQGAPWDGPWAVAFVGAGPWVSPTPEVPAHPAQVYEALWLLAGLPLVMRLAGRRRATERPLDSVLTRLRERQLGGLLFGTALAWFVAGRVIVGFTWRDEPIIGPLNAEQAIALAILAGIGTGLVFRRGSIVAADTTTTPREPAP